MTNYGNHDKRKECVCLGRWCLSEKLLKIAQGFRMTNFAAVITLTAMQDCNHDAAVTAICYHCRHRHPFCRNVATALQPVTVTNVTTASAAAPLTSRPPLRPTITPHHHHFAAIVSPQSVLPLLLQRSLCHHCHCRLPVTTIITAGTEVSPRPETVVTWHH